MTWIKLMSVFAGSFCALLFANCGEISLQPVSSQTTETAVEEDASQDLIWQQIALSIEVRVSAKSDDGRLLVGETGIIAIDAFGATKNYSSIKIRREFSSYDGGLTRKQIVPKQRFTSDERSFPNVCEPKNIALMEHNLYVFAECEHSSQLWIAKAEKGFTYLDVTNFTSNYVSSNDSIQQPIGLKASGNMIIMPAFIRSGPALLSPNVKTGNLRIIWQGDQNDGGVAAVEFVQDGGWMLLGRGKILQSDDGGSTWSRSSFLSTIAVHDFIDVRFLNSNEGYILGSKGALLNTSDGGKTWELETRFSTTDLSRIVISDKSIVVSTSSSNLLIRNKQSDKWETRGRPSGELTDLFFLNEKLFALIDGQLFFTLMK